MREKIRTLLKDCSEEKQRPDGSVYHGISLIKELEIAQRTGAELYDIEGLALACGITPIRFSRNQRFLSLRDQQKLHRASVAVIGLGGLGGAVTELLARLGVGNLTLIDGDVFDETNLNRQQLCTTSNLGTSKAEVATTRVGQLNPATRITGHAFFLNQENGPELLATVDCVIDCLDTITDRFVLEKICKGLNIPMVSAAIAGCSGQATLIEPGKNSLKTVYGDPEKAPQRGVEASLGTLAYTAAFMASIECAEVVNIILGKKSCLRGNLLFADLSDYSVQHIRGV
ncbi:HesA/MoeB/ThiF family protein [Desulforhopalus sp. IMCC35007]|uniref:HesA/MoeB/ThiF family protein n=1 Tax=Desulforhopalus sp. IMCC35007 TaxID=2569543 RepID=UPI00145FB8F9|nr:HesA/MoeB/ThiF family protein [Desulforhopalus sp. IMCC35007]